MVGFAGHVVGDGAHGLASGPPAHLLGSCYLAYVPSPVPPFSSDVRGHQTTALGSSVHHSCTSLSLVGFMALFNSAARRTGSHCTVNLRQPVNSRQRWACGWTGRPGQASAWQMETQVSARSLTSARVQLRNVALPGESRLLVNSVSLCRFQSFVLFHPVS